MNLKKEYIYKLAVVMYKASQGLHHKKNLSSKQNHKILKKILESFIKLHQK